MEENVSLLHHLANVLMRKCEWSGSGIFCQILNIYGWYPKKYNLSNLDFFIIKKYYFKSKIISEIKNEETLKKIVYNLKLIKEI